MQPTQGQAKMRDRALWERIAAAEFLLATGPLAEAVRKGTSLNARRAEAAVVEYRRFLYLAATGSPAVPSPVVDAVWHLHLLDTRAYIEGFCLPFLGRVLHHVPGRPGQAADPGYSRTLARYRDEFGMAPPPRIWPSPALLGVQGWIGAPVVAGVGLVLLGAIAGWGARAILAGAALAAVPLAGWMALGPWPVRPGGGDGGSGGTSVDGDGCGGD
jgi:hypothetical protein